MEPDKFTATWVSYSSITDFLRCPRAYYLKHVYKDPKTGHKINLITPPLALGQATHEVFESLSELITEKRFEKPLTQRLNAAWEKVSGKKGGFLNSESEHIYKRRAEKIFQRIYRRPGPLKELEIKIKKDLPYFWLSEEDNIILCGKVDWLEYISQTDSIHIIDFKTGKKKEQSDSLQLPIYCLLAKNCQKRSITKASYWYVETDDAYTTMPLPQLDATRAQVLDIGRKIKLARQLNKLKCPHNGCKACALYEKIIQGECECVGRDQFGADVYVSKAPTADPETEGSIIL